MKKDKEILSEQDIRKYFDKKTPSGKKNAMDKKALADPLYTEALEGYAAFPEEAKNVKNVKNQLKRKMYGKSFLPLYMAGLILFVAIAAYFYSGKRIYSEKAPDINHLYNKKEPEVQKALIPGPPVPMPGEEKADLKNSKNSIHLQTEKEQYMERKRNAFKPIEIITPAVLLSPGPNSNKRARSNRRYNFPVDYIRELKVADYSKEEIRNRDLPSSHSSNVEARYADENDLKKTDVYISRVSYRDFLQETMDKYVSGDYASSIVGFKLIRNHFPGDANALFYSGLCYYNLGLADKAIASFEQVQAGYINVFDEEAEWYQALSLEMKKDKETAKILFEKIARQQGFYAEKASVKLKSLNGF